jgi:hypothetical protein
VKIQFGLKCPYGRPAAIVALSPFDVGHDRTPSIGQTTSYQCCCEALDLGFELANLAVGIAQEPTQQERLTGYVLKCHGSVPAGKLSIDAILLEYRNLSGFAGQRKVRRWRE